MFFRVILAHPAAHFDRGYAFVDLGSKQAVALAINASQAEGIRLGGEYLTVEISKKNVRQSGVRALPVSKGGLKLPPGQELPKKCQDASEARADYGGTLMGARSGSETVGLATKGPASTLRKASCWNCGQPGHNTVQCSVWHETAPDQPASGRASAAPSETWPSEVASAAGFLFVCSNATERDCLDRNLLGLPAKSFTQLKNVSALTYFCLFEIYYEAFTPKIRARKLSF